MNYAIETKELTRTFKAKKAKKDSPSVITALEKVNITVQSGELFGLLGPNGAGKTTLIKILSTLLSPTSGTALVDGLDVSSQAHEVRKRINMVSGGEHSGYGILNVEENLWMFSQFYGVDNDLAFKRIDEMLEVLGLAEFRKTRIGKLSTGMRQKMNLIRGFVTDPKILFLDEPTLGLDVQISRDVRKYVKNWVKNSSEKTILLTTHYMAEADELCDRVAIIDQGKVIACDTPANLKRLLKQEAVFHIDVNLTTEKLDRFSGIRGVKNFAFEHKPHVGKTELKFILESDSVISQVTDALETDSTKIISLSKTEPSLEDVFVALVGKGLGNES
jgi:ABC-2 type transport system ATP-binding protein